MSKPTSLGVVQSRCASHGAVLVSICANIFQTVFARCSLPLQALLKASNPWQPALKWVMERPCAHAKPAVGTTPRPERSMPEEA